MRLRFVKSGVLEGDYAIDFSIFLELALEGLQDFFFRSVGVGLKTDFGFLKSYQVLWGIISS